MLQSTMKAVIGFSPRVAGILSMLIYPIQFEKNPIDGIDRVVYQVVNAEHLKVSLSEVTAAIDSGLASPARLSELIPQRHFEAVVRRFLSALRNRLQN